MGKLLVLTGQARSGKTTRSLTMVKYGYERVTSIEAAERWLAAGRDVVIDLDFSDTKRHISIETLAKHDVEVVVLKVGDWS